MALQLPDVLSCELLPSPEALFSVTILEICPIYFLQNLAESFSNSRRAMVGDNALSGTYREQSYAGIHEWFNKLALLVAVCRQLELL